MNGAATWRPARVSVAAWTLYDLANTVFALGVSALYFPDWLAERDTPDLALALAIDAAMIVVIVLSPWIGARSDHLGRRVPYLVPATLVAVVPTMFLASVGVPMSLVLFAVALVGFNLGGVVYDALLPDVSTEANRGQVSGLGVAVGYVGSFVALGVGAVMLNRYGHAAVFKALALLFLLFAVPAFFLIEERRRPRRPGPAPRIAQSLRGLAAAWRRARRFPGVARFLIGRFLYTDAINTLIGGFLTILVVEEFDFTDGQVQALLGASIAAAMVGGFAAGRLVDRVGPRRVLHGALAVWMIGLALVAFGAFADIAELAWVLGVGGGAALGATWASDRAYMARLSPPEHLGEFYGLYATVGRFATVLGPLMWGLLVTVAGLPRAAAVLALLAFLVAGRAVLAGVSDGHEAPAQAPATRSTS